MRGLLYQLTGDESLAQLPVTLAPAGNAEAMRARTWSDPRVDNYHRNAHGRSAANCPFEGTEMWRWLRHPEPGDLVVR